MTVFSQETESYQLLFLSLKQHILSAQLRAMFSVNKELILLYWHVGQEILQKQNKEGWGAKVIDRLSADLRKEFPNQQGLSPRNLKYMRAFAEAWPDREFVQQVVAQIPWGHNLRILENAKSEDERVFYITQTVKNAWSRTVLVHHIEAGLYGRQGKAITNFKETLLSPQSDLSQQLIKDPYIFDFLTIDERAREKELEENLLIHIREFLLELGVGFAFVGNQYRLEVSEKEYFIDLLFYHLNLQCFVVVELKTTEFQPEFTGKMNFYLSAVDDLVRKKKDNPTIGIIICKSKNKVIVEYALRDTTKPIGITTYSLKLPKSFASSLPTISQLERELTKVEKKE